MGLQQILTLRAGGHWSAVLYLSFTQFMNLLFKGHLLLQFSDLCQTGLPRVEICIFSPVVTASCEFYPPVTLMSRWTLHMCYLCLFVFYQDSLASFHR